MLYLDTSNPSEIKKYKDLGIIQGITTNQKILQQEGKNNVKQAIKDILEVSRDLSLNVELTNTSGTDSDLIFEATEYADLSKNIVIKIPMWGDGRGIRLARLLRKNSISTNITCCMSAEQALIAGLADVEYVSLFFRRIVDHFQKNNYSLDEGYDEACNVIKATNHIFTEYNISTQVIIGSIRDPLDVINAFTNGADIVTVPPKILNQMFIHPKTEETIKEFDLAWNKTKEVK